jgi:serine/threonine-protein kinase HipA
VLTHVLLGLLHNFRVTFLSASTTLDNAMSECDAFGLTPVEAAAEVVRVVDVVNTWKLHFAEVGVSTRDIESLAQQIDGDYLLQQRNGFEPGRFVAPTGKRPRKSPFKN